MARGSGPSRLRKRVEAETAPASSSSALKRARDGSAFAKCDECNKDVPIALISFHNCSLDAKIKMNLEAQVIEVPNENKKPERKKAAKQAEPKAKKEKKAKTSIGRKRPPTAFFLFMDDFRKSFKEANPDCKSVATVAKEGGEKWKSMSDEDKKVYVDRAAELKAEFEKAKESNEADDNQPEDANNSSEKEAHEEVLETDKEEAKEEVEVDEDE
ncbi:high mobility group B protein 7 [Andrographis paniculata]|uniref:high mobility group B protein 7 n=1 Tax=Andrographis paniculata TaxID=175694 RepID=UPI0021E73631|nr:high mobility group B protein 7 [Andrographis paniculata]